jgi:hypothetical protein
VVAVDLSLHDAGDPCGGAHVYLPFLQAALVVIGEVPIEAAQDTRASLHQRHLDQRDEVWVPAANVAGEEVM